jgi:hypothetical protein
MSSQSILSNTSSDSSIDPSFEASTPGGLNSDSNNNQSGKTVDKLLPATHIPLPDDVWSDSDDICFISEIQNSTHGDNMTVNSVDNITETRQRSASMPDSVPVFVPSAGPPHTLERKRSSSGKHLVGYWIWNYII